MTPVGDEMVAIAVPDKLYIVTYLSKYYNVICSMTPGRLDDTHPLELLL